MSVYVATLTQIARPTSLHAITHRIVHCEYAQPALFEQDMLQLFSNARTWYGLGTPGYKEMVTLQRLYQQLTPSKGALHDASGKSHVKARATDIDVVDSRRAGAHASHYFASSAYGPGNEPSDAAADAHKLLDHAYFKGRAYRAGDWVHLMNPVDPSRPIVGQLFRVYQKKSTPGIFVTACWYYRPEQTSHADSRLFAENEVVKTGVFGEHALEDIMEEVLVLFHTKYTRARPVAEYSTPNVPLYIVESKYDVRTHEFHKIQSWASCVPADVRTKHTPMTIFAVPSEVPKRSASLLTSNLYAPGFGVLLEHARRDDEPHEYRDLFDTGVRAAEAAAPTPAAAPPRPAVADLNAAHPDRLRAYAAFHMVASDVARRTSPASYAAVQQALLARPEATHGELIALGVRYNVPDGLIVRLRDAARNAGVLHDVEVSHAPSVPGLAPVLATHRAEGTFGALPAATRDLFRQDIEGKTLWYAAPPLSGWNGSTAVQDGTTQLPLPSLSYMYEMVRKHGNPVE